MLDHRSQVYIPELDRTFDCPPGFRVFACQNPMNQGGGRKGLPASFLNRFTKVYLNELTRDDLLCITQYLYPTISADTLAKMIDFNHVLHQDTMVHRRSDWCSRWFGFLKDVMNLKNIFFPRLIRNC